MPSPAPAAIELLAALHAGLLDPGLWREWQEEFARDTSHSIVPIDGKGSPLQESISHRLMAHDGILGAFTSGEVESSGHRHTEAEVGRAEELARQIAMVIENIAANRALREADRLKDEFFAVVGHELRSPLAAISNAMQLVRLKSLADPELGLATEVLERQVQQMTRLIDDLVDVSRVRQGKIHLDREVLDLRIVVARAVETSRPRIDARNHHLELSLPEQATEVDGDLNRLAQVVSNLLNNSAKYTDKGGRIELSLEAGSDQAILRVRDTGVGIAPAMLPTVFDLFTQVRGCEGRSEGGLGIGLSLVRNVIELHGGHVQALSAGLGHGSEFVVRLPLARTGHPPTPGTADIPVRNPTALSRRILVIDDNRDAADTMAMLLRVLGHAAQTAYDGPTALDLARLNPPEVVFCDISMPGMSGLEVARRLRHDLGLRAAFMVAVTGYGQEEDKLRSRQADFDVHLIKPASLEALQALLARATSLIPGLP